jgi:hypothetical protein
MVSESVDVSRAVAAGGNGNGIELAAASFIEVGLRFIETLAIGVTPGGPAGAPARRLDQALSSLFTSDSRMDRPALTIPLPESVTQERLANAMSALLDTSGQTARGFTPAHHLGRATKR